MHFLCIVYILFIYSVIRFTMTNCCLIVWVLGALSWVLCNSDNDNKDLSFSIFFYLSNCFCDSALPLKNVLIAVTCEFFLYFCLCRQEGAQVCVCVCVRWLLSVPRVDGWGVGLSIISFNYPEHSERPKLTLLWLLKKPCIFQE